MHFTYILLVLESHRFNCVTSKFPLVISVGREGEDWEADTLKLIQVGLSPMARCWYIFLASLKMGGLVRQQEPRQFITPINSQLMCNTEENV